MSERLEAPMDAVLQAALDYPGAVEEFPWGERVVKVNKKIFVFLGRNQHDEPVVTLKLPDSGQFTLSLPDVSPTGYGLGKHGWVSFHLTESTAPDADDLLEWLDESYRAVAPKRMIAELDARS